MSYVRFVLFFTTLLYHTFNYLSSTFLKFFTFILLGIFSLLKGILLRDKFTTPTYNKYKSKYDRLLHDDRWYDKRMKILDRDNHKCKYCGSTYNLQVHHKYYNKYPNEKMAMPWDYPDDALITLCDNCHKREHERKQIKTYYRKLYKHFV